ncbi:hypothetical protein NKH60_33740 [Mesorhizobium sp. M1006]|uniref:hypothetical protein n=1 Tax=Mesorhizobium sp. M1006 TaxID=2957048 RepID=UPI0033384B5A
MMTPTTKAVKPPLPDISDRKIAANPSNRTTVLNFVRWFISFIWDRSSAADSGTISKTDPLEISRMVTSSDVLGVGKSGIALGDGRRSTDERDG